METCHSRDTKYKYEPENEHDISSLKVKTFLQCSAAAFLESLVLVSGGSSLLVGNVIASSAITAVLVFVYQSTSPILVKALLYIFSIFSCRHNLFTGLSCSSPVLDSLPWFRSI